MTLEDYPRFYAEEMGTPLTFNRPRCWQLLRANAAPWMPGDRVRCDLLLHQRARSPIGAAAGEGYRDGSVTEIEVCRRDPREPADTCLLRGDMRLSSAEPLAIQEA